MYLFDQLSRFSTLQFLSYALFNLKKSNKQFKNRDIKTHYTIWTCWKVNKQSIHWVLWDMIFLNAVMWRGKIFWKLHQFNSGFYRYRGEQLCRYHCHLFISVSKIRILSSARIIKVRINFFSLFVYVYTHTHMRNCVYMCLHTHVDILNYVRNVILLL